MTTETLHPGLNLGAAHGEAHTRSAPVLFGFWVFLMSDLIIFGILFATYVSMLNGTAGGPGSHELYDFVSIEIQTGLLLLSSLTYGFASLALKYDEGRRRNLVAWLIVTAALGGGFLGFEISDFYSMAQEGGVPSRSGWLSAYYALVGLHGTHITVGLLWMAVMLVQIGMLGLSYRVKARLLMLGLYWHFLDLVWIGIFSIVFLATVVAAPEQEAPSPSRKPGQEAPSPSEKPGQQGLTLEEQLRKAEQAAQKLGESTKHLLEEEKAGQSMQQLSESTKQLQEKEKEITGLISEAESTAQKRLLSGGAPKQTREESLAKAAPPSEKAPARARHEAREESPRTVTVQSGDSLSIIAKRMYGDASKWRLIYEANRDQLKNPDQLRVGMKLTVPAAERVPARSKSEAKGRFPRTVTAQSGDSLSIIAKRMYGDASKWRLIYEANRDQLKNPDQLRVEMKLTVPAPNK